MALDAQELVDVRELLYQQGEQLSDVAALLRTLIESIGAIEFRPTLAIPESRPQVVIQEQDPQILVDAVERSFSPPLTVLAELVAGMRDNIDNLAEKITKGPPAILRGGATGLSSQDFTAAGLAKDQTLRDGSTHVAVDSLPAVTAADLDIRDLDAAQDSVTATVSNFPSVQSVDDNDGSLTVDATDLDIRDLNSATDSVTATPAMTYIEVLGHTTSGSIASVPASGKHFSLSVDANGTVTSWDVRLEGSLDNQNWTTLIQHTNVSPGDGQIQWQGNNITPRPVRFLRVNVVGLVLGLGTSIDLHALGCS